MKKLVLAKVLITITVIMAFILTYTNVKNTQFQIYDGVLLNVGVIGTLPDIQSHNVLLHQANLEQIAEDHIQYDAFVLTEDVFQEASLPTNKDVFISNFHTPVFFVGLYKPLWVYLEDDYRGTYDEAFSRDYMGHTQGYLMTDAENYPTWILGKGLSKDKINDKEINDIYFSLFKVTENIKNGNVENAFDFMPYE
ncbi:hypothetical protein [Cytobacillus sp. IB215665]|uniref:hypothetical protein n=1 Tax=Cytobacillus sp. IB215665 TaxID=3097357 RepID=UPI002A1826A6|nr:hypothetical protein [Cytobacillus sp. IB215665]MDX8366314.1 hypothetical protein [Cytobacillus sp. IB215665]